MSEERGERDQLARQVLQLAQNVTGVSARLNALASFAEDVEKLRARIEDLPTGAQLTGVFAEISAQITSLTNRIGALESLLPSEPKLKLWDWSQMEPAAAEAAMGQLTDWVSQILGGTYKVVGFDRMRGTSTKTARLIPPCWPQHPDLVREISWLFQEWMLIYRSNYGTPAKAGDWHDRHLMGVRRRIPEGTAAGCSGEHVDGDERPAWDQPAPDRGAGPGWDRY